MNKIEFEEIPLCILNKKELHDYFSNVLESNEKKYISFINPEIILQQEKNEILHNYFKYADMNFIDGINLLYAINTKLHTNYTIKDRLPGTDFFNYLPTEKPIKIFFYGAKEENCLLAKEKIENKYSFINICGFINGYTNKTNEEIIKEINSCEPDILIVCLGCPRQESWIQENLSSINTKLAFGNGGSIDFWSGNTKRAPVFLINLGLEWLYRLFASFSFKRLIRQLKLFKFLFYYKFKKYKIIQL